MNFGIAFSYMFKDSDWFKKMVIAGLLLLIPLLGQLVVLGWALSITRRVIEHDPLPLPSVDFGNDLGRGFSAFVIALVYSLPVILLAGFLGVVDAVATSLTDGEIVMYMMAFLSICTGLFSLIYGLLLAVMLPAAYGNFAARGALSAAFNFREVFCLVKNAPGAYVMVVLGALVVGFVAPLGVIACIIGVIVTMVYAQAVMGHLYGQAYKVAASNAVFSK
jgi:hypothetical protein